MQSSTTRDLCVDVRDCNLDGKKDLAILSCLNEACWIHIFLSGDRKAEPNYSMKLGVCRFDFSQRKDNSPSFVYCEGDTDNFGAVGVFKGILYDVVGIYGESSFQPLKDCLLDQDSNYYLLQMQRKQTFKALLEKQVAQKYLVSKSSKTPYYNNISDSAAAGEIPLGEMLCKKEESGEWIRVYSTRINSDCWVRKIDTTHFPLEENEIIELGKIPSHQIAYLTGDNVTLRRSPKILPDNKITLLHLNQKVTIKSKQKQDDTYTWIEIETEKGENGWVRGDFISQDVNVKSAEQDDHDILTHLVDAYLEAISNKDINAICSFYDSTVNYFSLGTVDRNFIVSDKVRYFKNISSIKFERTNHVRIFSTADETIKKVLFQISFYFVRGGKKRSGIAENEFTVKSKGERYYIIGEKQNIRQ